MLIRVGTALADVITAWRQLALTEHLCGAIMSVLQFVSAIMSA